MQLDNFYCETVGGVFCATNNSFPSMRDLKIPDKGSSENMSVSGDRKRKYINNSGNNERETRNEHTRQNSIRVQQRQGSEDSNFVDNDQPYTTKKTRGRKCSKAGKNDKTGDKFEKQLPDDEVSNGEQQLTKNATDCYNLRDKIHLSASENGNDDSKVSQIEEAGNDDSDCQTDPETTEMHKEAVIAGDSYHEIHQKPALYAKDKDDSNEFQKDERKFTMSELSTNGIDGKNPSPIHDLTENVENICDDSNNVNKRSNTQDDGNSFSIEKICDPTPSYDIHQNDTNIDSNHITETKQLSPLYNEERLPINNNGDQFESAPPITPVDGCAANSKFTKFPNVEHETNIEPECDTVNERVTQKNDYQVPEEMFNYKQELDKSDINEGKSTECATSSWEAVNRNQSYSDTPEACCFSVKEVESNSESGLAEQTHETKPSQLDLYADPLQQAYSVHQQHQRQKKNPTEEFPNDNEIINRKTDTDQLTKLQSEQQQVQQHDFSHLSLQNPERQQHQSQHDHYRQFQPHDQQNSYEQMFETDQRGQQIHSEQQNQDHAQQYTQEQFYQMRLQQQHHLGQVMPLMPQQHPNLQDSLQEEHLMAYLHHQAAIASAGHQSRLQQDIYQDLMMDEFHEDVNAASYKLRHLSPTTAKHENQDDGYETSAGDVLTPNSHSSSTQSGTPQLPVSLHAPTSSLALQNMASTTNCSTNPDQQHAPMQTPQATNTQSSCGTHSSERFNRDTTVNIPHDPYKFTGNSGACLTDKVERLFPMQSEQPNQHNHNLTATTMHGDGLSSIKSDIVDMIVNKEGTEALGKPPQKRRGRKKKVPTMEGMPSLQSSNMINPVGMIESTDADGSSGLVKVKERKKHDRFNGMSEEEVVKRTLPDHLCHNLDIVIIGINPGLFAAYKGHHYAGPGNHFWKCLYLSGLTQEQMSADEDYKLIKCGIGFTNMVQRATKGSADLTRKEIKEGSRILLEKLQRFQPKIAVFNGKLIFEVFSGKKDFNFGRQPECVEGTNTYVWVMPSSSARCAQLPRAADKVPFYAALKKFRDYLNGLIPQIDEAECVFTEQRIRQMCEQEQLKNLAQSHSACSYSNVTDCPPTSAEQEHQSRDYSAYSNSDNQLNSGAVNVSESTIGGPGPPPMVSHGNGYLVPSNFSGTPHPTPEKKKRGRPKKLRIQEIIDPNTGQKIQITNAQHHQQSNVNNDFNNILNLSIMSSEVPKKKRGRPKKVKTLPTEMHPSGVGENSTVMLQNKQSQSQNPTVAQQPQQISLYNNPPNAGIQQQMYGPSAASPNHSPALNSTTVGVNNGSVYTPPNNVTSAQMTPPMNESSVELGASSNKHNLGESTPPPSSPNICAVDFEPPNNSENRSQGELHSQQLPTNLQQRSRFEAPHIVGVDNSTNESFHQWMSPSHQFNYQTSLQQDNQQQYQAEHSLSIHHRPQKQTHENHAQHSPHSPWATTIRNQHFESNESSHQQQHYMNAMHAASQHHQQQLQQHEPQQSQLHHQTVQHSTDVATKSLSGLESLVDQIPTIAESEAAAAAVESRLQTLQRGSTPASFADMQAESYEGSLLSENRGPSSLGNPTSLAEGNNDTIGTSRNSSNGSNTPHFGVNSGPSCASPINHYGLQRHGQTASAASSPHAHAPYSGNISGGASFPLNSNTSQHSPSVASDLLTNSHTPPTMANSSTTNTNSSTTTSHHLFSNFSVSHLAASSVTSCSSNHSNNNNKSSDWQSSGARSPYHHPNLMAAAALQLHTAAASSSPTANAPHQMYIDPHTSIHHHPHHTHLSSPHQHHVQVNSLYSSATQAAHTHHHPGMAVAYGAPPPTSQHPSHHVHNAGSDYGAYGATAAAAAAAHMLHMPNPNYSPYGYGTAPPPPVPTAATQNTYSSWNHHGHPTASSHHPHHLSMFERLKPSDIGSYSSF